MLAASRAAIGNLRIAQPRIATIRTREQLVGGTFCIRRWFTKKVNNDLITRQLIERRQKILEASGACKSPPYPGCNSEHKTSQYGCIDPERTPIIGEAIQYPGEKPSTSRPKRSDPKLEHSKSPAAPNCSKKSITHEAPVEESLSAKPSSPPACPPPNTSGSGSNSNNSYIFGAIALTAGGLGLAYAMGLFDQKEPILEKADPEAAPVQPKKKAKLPYPPSSKDLPSEVPYLLIGGGTASFAAFRAIKGHDAKAKVLVITNETEMPYMRPPLSKELWFNPEDKAKLEPLKFRQWNGVERSIYFEPDDFYVDPTKLMDSPNGGVAIARGYEVKRIDVENRKAILTDGTEIKYGECLLATGARPKNLPVFESAPLTVKERISMFKAVSDFEELTEKLNEGSKIAIIGGGFLGSELSCALVKCSQIRNKNFEVYQLFHEEGNMGKILPEYLSRWTTERVREEGVKVWPKIQVKAADVHDNKLKLTLSDDSCLLVDHAIVAVGSEPNTDLAKTSNLETDPSMGGFVVDAELRARSHLYVAGDAACFFDPKLGRRRVEHHDHAVVSGRLAGENMVGLNKPYTHQSMFWSDLGPKIGYEAIGIIDSALPTVAVFAKSNPPQTIPDTSEKLQAANASVNSNGGESTPSVLGNPNVVRAEQKTASPSEEEKDDFNKGVIFYLKDEKVVGVLLWNVFNRIGTARRIVAQHTRYDDLNEVAKLFNLHERPEESESSEATEETQ